MKKNILLASFFYLITLSFSCHAWNANGHILISQLAYEQLTPDVQKKVKDLSTLFFKQLPFATQYQLDNQYPNVSKFAQLSVLPDQFRKQPLISLFEQYQAPLPKLLEPLAQENTYHWHFTTQTYPRSYCKIQQAEHDLFWSISTLKNILLKEKNLLSQALVMIMLTHLIEDAHQPLHTFSHVNHACMPDKGGNLFCLTFKSKGTYCKHNLHHLWDTGVGFLKGRQAHFLRKFELIREQFSSLEDQIDSTQWADEGLAYAEFIYSLEPNTKPGAFYYRTGQGIAKKRLALASKRLASLLNEIFKH